MAKKDKNNIKCKRGGGIGINCIVNSLLFGDKH